MAPLVPAGETPPHNRESRAVITLLNYFIAPGQGAFRLLAHILLLLSRHTRESRGCGSSHCPTALISSPKIPNGRCGRPHLQKDEPCGNSTKCVTGPAKAGSRSALAHPPRTGTRTGPVAWSYGADPANQATTRCPQGFRVLVWAAIRICRLALRAWPPSPEDASRSSSAMQLRTGRGPSMCRIPGSAHLWQFRLAGSQAGVQSPFILPESQIIRSLGSGNTNVRGFQNRPAAAIPIALRTECGRP